LATRVTTGRAERGELRVLEVQFGGGAAEELGVLRDRAGPAALDEADTELVQLPRDDELVGHAEVQALLLGAIAQGRVVDVKGVVEHRIVSWNWLWAAQTKRPLASTREVCAPTSGTLSRR
jgi:hypothetical protein